MKKIITSAMLPGIATLLVAGSAFAQSHQHQGHGHSHTHGHQSEQTQNSTNAQKVEGGAQNSSTSHTHHTGHNHHAATHHEASSPFYGHLDVKIHADSIVSANEADEEINEIYAHSHIELGARIGSGLSLNTNIKLEGEPSGHDHGGGGAAPNGRDRIFKAHPLVVESLTANYDDEMISLYGGKFNPIVGFDYHNFGGLYTYQTIEEYALREKIGLGVALKHDAGKHGHHRFDASTFFADTSFLSNSLLFERGRTRKSAGGVSNTEDFSSFALSLGGREISLSDDMNTKLSYRFGFAEQAAGRGNDNDETRYSASLGVHTFITPEVSASLVGEHMHIDHLGGEAAHDRSYTTAALRLGYQGWNLSGAYTFVHNNAADPDEGAEGSVFQVSAGYLFACGLGLDIGYQRTDEENEVTKRIGALLSYSKEF